MNIQVQCTFKNCFLLSADALPTGQSRLGRLPAVNLPDGTPMPSPHLQAQVCGKGTSAPLTPASPFYTFASVGAKC